MKAMRLSAALVIVFGFVSSAQTNEQTLRLTGLVSLPDLKCALFEVPSPPSRRPTPMILSEGQREAGLEVLRIDSTSGSVEVRYNGTATTLRFSENEPGSETVGGAITSSPALHLQRARGMQVLDLYYRVADRNVLLSSIGSTQQFALVAAGRTRAEVAAALERLFRTQGIAAVPAGEKFVMLVPEAFTNALSSLSHEIPARIAKDPSSQIQSQTNAIPPRAINFRNAPAEHVLFIYEDYIGRKFANRDSVRSIMMTTFLTFINATPLTHSEVCYALEMLFACNRIGIVRNDDGTFNVVRFDPRAAP